MKIEKFSEKYTSRLHRICVETSDAGDNKKSAEYTCALYCDGYLKHGLAYMLLDEENEAQGYILCSPAFSDYEKQLLEALPKLDMPHRLIARAGARTYRQYSKNYPAHLHVDILSKFTGKGYGSMLMEALFAELKGRGVRGVMLQAGSGNHKAIRFYKKHGFCILKKGPFVTAMGRKL